MKQRWPKPDFLAPPARPPLLAWLWAATGVIVLGAALDDSLARRQGLDEQARQLSQAQSSLAALRPARPAAPVPADRIRELEAVNAAQRLLERLDHPWPALLGTMESETPAGVQWLGLDHDSASDELRFDGLARDPTVVLQMVDMIAAHAGWSDVAVTRLQAPPAQEGEAAPAAWRFEIRATVDARRIAAGRPDSGI